MVLKDEKLDEAKPILLAISLFSSDAIGIFTVHSILPGEKKKMSTSNSLFQESVKHFFSDR